MRLLAEEHAKGAGQVVAMSGEGLANGSRAASKYVAIAM
jgi:hypothetical protein